MTVEFETRCRWVRSQLGRYLDSELSPPLEARVGRHLAGCAGCREALAEEEAAVVGAIDALSSAEPAPALPHRIALALEEDLGRARHGRRIGWSAAAAVLLALAAGALWRSGADPAAPLATGGAETDLAARETPHSGDPEPDAGPVWLPLRGDLDGDGSASLADLRLLASFLGRDGVTIPCEAAGDLDGDRVLSPADLYAQGHLLLYGYALRAEPRIDAGDELPCDDAIACL